MQKFALDENTYSYTNWHLKIKGGHLLDWEQLSTRFG